MNNSNPVPEELRAKINQEVLSIIQLVVPIILKKTEDFSKEHAMDEYDQGGMIMTTIMSLFLSSLINLIEGDRLLSTFEDLVNGMRQDLLGVIENKSK